jgi:hypothetical protein
VVCIIIVSDDCSSSVVRVLCGLFCRSLMLHLMFLVVPVVVFVSTLFCLNTKCVIHDLKKNIKMNHLHLFVLKCLIAAMFETGLS